MLTIINLYLLIIYDYILFTEKQEHQTTPHPTETPWFGNDKKVSRIFLMNIICINFIYLLNLNLF